MALESDSLLQRAIAALVEKNFENAAQLFEKAVVAAPLRPDLHYHLGNTFTALEKTDKAIDQLQHALSLDAEYPEAHNNLGRIFHQQNNFEKACYHYQEAIKHREHYNDAELNLGLLWVQQGNYDRAKNQFESILTWNSKFPVVYEQLAQLALRDEDTLKAKYYYKKRLQYPIGSSDTWNNIGAVFSQVSDYDEALEAFTKALNIHPEHVEARNNRAAIYLQQGNLKAAIWEYTLYLRLLPSDAAGHYNLGVALMLSGRLEEAVETFQKAINLYPDYLDAWCNLGAIYTQQSKPQLAYEVYQQVLIKNPEHETAQFMVSALNQSEKLKNERTFEFQKIPEAAPLSYVKGLFNHYADYFEKHLQNLNYQVPRKLYHWVQPYLKEKKFNTLDLGCGTGLIGEAFQTNISHLTGVDVSTKMLKEAEKKSIYNTLIEKDILSFLKQSEEHYELILCADTLVYFGELKKVMEGAFKVASRNAYFALSVELFAAESNVVPQKAYYFLQATGRYQHLLLGVRKVAEHCGWKWVDSFSIKGRLHHNQPVTIKLCLLQKLF